VEGVAVNSAAPSVRDPYSTSWFDYDVSIGIAFPGAFTNSDFDNHGDNTRLPATKVNAGDFTNLNVGAKVQFGGLGVAATGDLEQFSLTTAAPGTPGLTLQIARWKALAAYSLFEGQLAVGGGARIVTMQVLQNNGGTLLNMSGAAPEAGVLLMPTGRRWRMGASARAPVSGGVGVEFLGAQILPGATSPARTAGNCSSPSNPDCFALPSQVVMPWEAELGFAYQLGPRPLNPGWENPHEQEAQLRGEIERDRAQRQRRYDEELASVPPAAREGRRREQAVEERSVRKIEDEHLDEESELLRQARKARYLNWPRERILLLASVLMTGASPNAVSVEGFLQQTAVPAGREVSFTPRLGLEGEPLQNRMLLRAGTYLEPSRYEGGNARQHFTFGADVHLFPLTFWGLLPDADWKLGLFVDLAPRYTNWGFGLGNWH
jgi:hypothetical protein